ncbi:MAG: serine kinase [Bacteroidales bacterium]|jgi:serine kinase of HPr protein (carbohydrate metabolism regulator)|nr:serine kinase [Bacteroidales bacterium]
MTVKEIMTAMNLTLFCGEHNLNQEVAGGYVSDLLSDVMGSASADYAWITLQTHINVVAVATLKDLACIILVKGQQPDPDMLSVAQQKEVILLGTAEEAFETAGKLYQLLQK